MTKKNWFPDLHQISAKTERNKSWLHSVHLGLFYSIIYFPTMIWQWSLKPFLTGLFSAFVGATCFVIAGFKGTLHSDFDTLPQAYGRMLDKQIRDFQIDDSSNK